MPILETVGEKSEYQTSYEAYEKDHYVDKINLVLGIYLNEEGQSWVLPVVRAVESQMAADLTLNKEYLPMTGSEEYCQCSLKLLLGEGNPLISCKRAEGVQTIGGTGALFLAYYFMSFIKHRKTILVSSQTWPNHISMAKIAQFETIKEYRYLDDEQKRINFAGMVEDIKSAPNGSVIILQACAHNPTGMDLSKNEWISLSEIIKEKEIAPIFDIAYQGFASGNLDDDAWPVRYFAEHGFELLACQSFSKNFGLYSERVGNITIIAKDATITGQIKSQVANLARQTWLNPPNHGSKIVSTVLGNAEPFSEWKGNVKSMADRVKLMRQILFQKLQTLGTPGTWNHIVNQVGMFSFTGLKEKQLEILSNKYHIHLMNNGRLNMSGLNYSNIDYIAKAIDEAVRDNTV